MRRPDGAEGRPATVDRGAADALGLVLIAPAIIGLALLVVVLGRRVDTTAQVRSAAEAAAQAAALERDAGSAAEAAAEVVDRTLGASSTCSNPQVETAYPPRPAPGDEREVGIVRVTVSCEVSGRFPIEGDFDEGVTALATVDFFRAAP